MAPSETQGSITSYLKARDNAGKSQVTRNTNATGSSSLAAESNLASSSSGSSAASGSYSQAMAAIPLHQKKPRQPRTYYTAAAGRKPYFQPDHPNFERCVGHIYFQKPPFFAPQCTCHFTTLCAQWHLLAKRNKDHRVSAPGQKPFLCRFLLEVMDKCPLCWVGRGPDHANHPIEQCTIPHNMSPEALLLAQGKHFKNVSDVHYCCGLIQSFCRTDEAICDLYHILLPTLLMARSHASFKYILEEENQSGIDIHHNKQYIAWLCQALPSPFFEQKVTTRGNYLLYRIAYRAVEMYIVPRNHGT